MHMYAHTTPPHPTNAFFFSFFDCAVQVFEEAFDVVEEEVEIEHDSDAEEDGGEQQLDEDGNPRRQTIIKSTFEVKVRSDCGCVCVGVCVCLCLCSFPDSPPLDVAVCRTRMQRARCHT